MRDEATDSRPNEPTDKPPAFWDAGLGWFLFLYFLLNVGMGVFPPLLPQVMGSLGLSFAEAGLLGTAFGLTRFVMDLPMALLVERFGFPRILQAGMAFYVIGSVLAAWAPSFGAMLLARGLTGLGSGTTNVVGILYLMHTGALRQRTRRANMYELSVIAGMAVSSELAGIVGGRWGWRWSFALATLAFGAAWLVSAAVVPKLRAVRLPVPPAKPTHRGHADGGARKALVAIYVAMFAQAFAWGGGISTLLPLYGGRALELSPEAIGRAMAIAFWAEVCLLFPVGWAADTWGKAQILIPGFFTILLAVLLAPATAGVWGYSFVFVALTSGMTVWMLVPALLTEHLRGDFRGRSAGFYRLVSDLGFILSPALVGWLIGRSGFWAAAGAMAGVVAVSIFLSLRFLARKS